MRRFIPNDVRFFKFSDITTLVNDNVDYLYTLIKNTFSEGYFSTENPNSVIKVKIVNFSTEKRLGIYIEPGKIFTFLSSGGLSQVTGKKVIKQSVFFDDLNPVNGTFLNKIKIQNKNLFVDNDINYSLIYSTKNFYILYLNGTVQDNSAIVVDEGNNDISIGFNKIRAGSLEPSPIKLNGEFSKELIEGNLTAGTFLNDFCNNEKDNCILEFPYLNTEITDKVLVIEIISQSLSIKYYHVPKDIPLYAHNAFFTSKNLETYKIKVSLGDIPISSSDKIKIYFASFAIPLENKGNLNFINKYRLGDYKNLSSESLSSKVIFALDEVQGVFSNISAIDAATIGNLVNLDIFSGEIELPASVLPYPSSKIYFKDIYYSPPVQVYRGIDYVNNLTIYGYPGNTFPIVFNHTYNVYVKNTENFDVVNTTINSFSEINNLLSSFTYLPNFILLDTLTNPPNDYTLVGSITTSSSPESANLSIDGNFYTPYTRLQAIASAINPPPKWRSVNLNKVSLSTGTTTFVEIPIIPVPVGHLLNFKGFTFIGRVVNSQNVDIPFTINFQVTKSSNLLVGGNITFPTSGSYLTSDSQDL